MPHPLTDRQAVIDLTVDYCWALDSHEWDALDRVFTPDATAELIGDLSGVEAIKARVRRALEPLDDSQHVVTTHQVRLDGDRASCRCYLYAQHVRRGTDGGDHYMVSGRYEDEMMRTADGWRISRRVLVPMWTEGNVAVVRP